MIYLKTYKYLEKCECCQKIFGKIFEKNLSGYQGLSYY